MAETTNKVPDVEVAVGETTEPTMEGAVQYEGECSFPNAAECLRMMEESEGGADIAEMVNRLSKTHSKVEFGVSALSSTATTVSSSMASQWINHMKKTFKRRAMVLNEEQQGAMRKLIAEDILTRQELYQPTIVDLAVKDILMLYSRGLEAHHDGRYREMFDRMRSCIPYFNTNVLVWIRVSEALIYEFYEEVWEFGDIYPKIFEKTPKVHRTSYQRKINDQRTRHSDMTLQFAETATLMTYVLAKHSCREPVHYAASSLHGFLLLKMKKYSEAIEAVNFTIEKYMKGDVWDDELNILLIYKAEGMLGIGRYNRAIEYCLKVSSVASSVRTKHRAMMLMGMAYMRKNNFKKAYECIMHLFDGGSLDEGMLENVTILGLNLAHLMGNAELFKRFETLLQLIVH